MTIIFFFGQELYLLLLWVTNLIKKIDIIKNSAKKLENWILDNNYMGYEPFDGLSSPLRNFIKNNLLLERILQQLVRQSPINLRPVLGIPRNESTKGRAYIAWGFLNKYKNSGDNFYKEKAIESLCWLNQHKSPYYPDHSWGNHFPYASRFGSLPIYEPTIVWTSLIGQIYLEAYEEFGISEHLEIAKSICNWIQKLPQENNKESLCLSYVATDQRSIHNSNMLGAAMLARTSYHTGNQELLCLAKKSMRYSCRYQLNNGAWYYGQEPKYHWIDNFHTGYNLDSLKRYSFYSQDFQFSSNLAKGYKYFKNNFFSNNGAPKYYHNRLHPIDIQCASQSIDTLVLFSDTDPHALSLASKVAIWTINNMQAHDGHFYYRKYPLLKSKTPMIHWGQATMYKALNYLILNLESS